MKRKETDIFISGGGIAGLIAAARFGAAGFKVILADPASHVIDANASGSDLRSTAFLQPARDLLSDVGLWEQLAEFATPLEVMRLADAGGKEAEIRVVADFIASEISDEPFAWNLPNWLLRREILQFVEKLPSVELVPLTKATRLTTRTEHAIVQLSNDTSVHAKMVIGADGRDSFIRSALGIEAHVTRYAQKALVFTVKHELPHQNISTEIHRTGGPFTLVPLPDANGKHQSSVVWMDHGPEIAKLAKLSNDAFSSAATERSMHSLGALSLNSPRRMWPIISQSTARLTGQRTALVAEAAHVVPPIGAQGLNMSLADIETLFQLGIEDEKNIGSVEMLAKFEKTRKRDLNLRARGIDLLNRAAMTNVQVLRDLRFSALKALHGTKPVRQGLMKMGLGR